MNIDDEYNYLIELCEKDLARGKKINHRCPYCGASLAGLFEGSKTKKKLQDLAEKSDLRDEPTYCPCCWQYESF